MRDNLAEAEAVIPPSAIRGGVALSVCESIGVFAPMREDYQALE